MLTSAGYPPDSVRNLDINTLFDGLFHATTWIAIAIGLIFRAYADEYLAWAKKHHRGWKTENSRIECMAATFGDAKLDEISSADVERFLDGLLAGEQPRSHSTVNRYRTLLHAMLNRAIRHALVSHQPRQGSQQVLWSLKVG